MHLVVLLVAAGLVAQGETLEVWGSLSQYIDFAVFKSCVGEKAALEAEKMGYEVGLKCLQQENAGTERRMTTFGPDGKIAQSSTRHKRNLLKYPAGASVALQICTIRGMKTITEDNDINVGVIDEWIEVEIEDQTLKRELLQLSSTCKEAHGTPPSFSGPISETEGFFKLNMYMNCLTNGGLKACQDYETRRYAHVFG